MRALYVFPLLVLVACAGTSPKDLEKMSTLDVCYEAMMDADKKPMAEAELKRRQESCDKYSEQLKQMASQEARAGGSVTSQDPKSTGAPGMSGGGMGGRGY